MFEIYSKSQMWQICIRLRIQWFSFSNMSSALFIRFFLAKNQKIVNVGEIGNYDKECFSRKKFSFFQKPCSHKWKAPNMPVLVSRFVDFSQSGLRLEIFLFIASCNAKKFSMFGENSSIIALLKLKSNGLLGKLLECNQPLNDRTYYG